MWLEGLAQGILGGSVGFQGELPRLGLEAALAITVVEQLRLRVLLQSVIVPHTQPRQVLGVRAARHRGDLLRVATEVGQLPMETEVFEVVRECDGAGVRARRDCDGAGVRARKLDRVPWIRKPGWRSSCRTRQLRRLLLRCGCFGWRIVRCTGEGLLGCIGDVCGRGRAWLRKCRVEPRTLDPELHDRADGQTGERDLKVQVCAGRLTFLLDFDVLHHDAAWVEVLWYHLGGATEERRGEEQSRAKEKLQKEMKWNETK